jgi:hypothetical protein
VETLNVGTKSVQVIAAGAGPTLIQNGDLTTTVYMGDTNAVTVGDIFNNVPLSPQSFLVVDGRSDVWAIVSSGSPVLHLIRGGLAFFQSGITAAGFISNNLGVFFYSTSTPQLGKLVASITPPTTTADLVGNAVTGEITSYVLSGGVYYAISLAGNEISFSFSNTASGPYSFLNSTVGLDSATGLNLLLTGQNSVVLTPLNGNVEIAGPLLLDSLAVPSNPNSGVILFGQSLTGGIVQPAYIAQQGVSRRLLGAESPATNINTITQSSFQNLSFTSLIAGDMNVGGVWEYYILGYGTWGSTQQSLTIQPRFGSASTSVVGNPIIIAATAFAASAAFTFSLKATLINLTTGTGATWVVMLEGIITQTANNLLPGTAADNTVPFATGSGSTNVTLDSTITESFGVSAKWASTTGAPTISKNVAWLVKVR